MSYFNNVDIGFSDSPAIDAFGRLRVANPETVFDSKQLDNSQSLFWDDVETSGSSTVSSFDTNNASTIISVASGVAGTRVRQTFQTFNYQPGKSQQILMTFTLGSGSNGLQRNVGYFNNDNGLFLRLDGTTLSFVVRSKTSGSAVDTVIPQSSWNLDKLDGTGSSGLTFDSTKTQILAIDFEWLGVGRVRFGFVFNGQIVYCHEENYANTTKDTVYISTPNLPLRYDITNDGTSPSGDLRHICSTVTSEGGQANIGVTRYASTSGVHVDANTADTIYAIVGIRKDTSQQDIVTKIDKVSLLSETADAFEWLIVLNPTVAGTFTYSTETNSSIQIARGATANTVTIGNGTIIDGGFVNTSQAISVDTKGELNLGVSITGAPDEIVVCARPLSINADIQGSITWREL